MIYRQKGLLQKSTKKTKFPAILTFTPPFLKKAISFFYSISHIQKLSMCYYHIQHILNITRLSSSSSDYNHSLHGMLVGVIRKKKSLDYLDYCHMFLSVLFAYKLISENYLILVMIVSFVI
jgi:hypothetical protein